MKVIFCPYGFTFLIYDLGQAHVVASLSVDREELFIEVSLNLYLEDIFHPAKFDNFKDEKI